MACSRKLPDPIESIIGARANAVLDDLRNRIGDGTSPVQLNFDRSTGEGAERRTLNVELIPRTGDSDQSNGSFIVMDDITGYDDQDAARDEGLTGHAAILQKPFDLAQLRAAVRAALGPRQDGAVSSTARRSAGRRPD